MARPRGERPLEFKVKTLNVRPNGEVQIEGLETNGPEDAQKFAELFAMVRQAHVGQAPTNSGPTHAFGSPPPKRTGKLSEVWERYMDGKSGIAPTSKVAYTHSYELFAELIGGGDRLFHEISDQELLDFVDALALVPINATKRGIRIGTMAELRQLRVRGEDGRMVEPERISASTKNGHRNRIKDFVGDAIRAGYRAGPNPIADSRRHSDGNEEGGADQFTTNELTRIFDPDKLLDAGPVV
jgi:hypothetical protein